MRKRYLSLLSFAILLCMMLIGIVSCKKDNGDDTPTQTGSDFFIEVDYLPVSETNGATAPRLIANFNDEAVMVEFRPSVGNNAETVLFLSPDNEAMMMCGDDSLMILVSYDLATYTPSNDVLVVTPANDALLLTKCVMNWNTNTMTKGDMMVLPIDDNYKGSREKGGNEDDMRLFFYNRLVKPLTENLEQVENLTSFLGIHTSVVLTYVKTIVATTFPVILFSDDSELLYEAMEHPVTMGTAQAAQFGVLYNFSRDLREMGYRLYSGLAWALHGGRGKVNDYGGEENDDFSYSTFWGQSNNAIESAGRIGIHPPAYRVFLDVSNATENSAYLKGRFQFTSSITPISMGYVFKVSGGPEQIVEDFNFNGKTITGLQKATKYQAYAYVENMEGRVISPEVTFWTLGFEVFPTSLIFPAEGGTKNVAVTYSLEDITYCEVTSNPSWCSFSLDDLGLLAITVGETTEMRSGTITITAHSIVLGNITQDISVTQYGPTPLGYFTGTPFDNTKWTVPLLYTHTSTGIRRVGEWHSNPNGIGGYYTYHTENYSETNSSNGVASPSFKDNTYFSYYGEEGDLSFEFKGDSIIMKLFMDGEGGIEGFVNGETSIFESESSSFPGWNTREEITLSRYFINSNTFCFRMKEDYTGGESYGGNNDWYKYHNVYDCLYTFTINDSNNTCSIDVDATETMNTFEFGSEYTGILSGNETTTGHGTGTYEYSVKGNNVIQGNNESDFMFAPRFPLKKHN